MSFTSNITMTKSFPAVIYNASEELSAYHEDHEIDGALWHVRNATYKETPPQQWSSVDHTQPSYATVQNTDGSTSYFSMAATSSTWTSWAGSGNNAVFNAVDFGMSTTATDNSEALYNAIIAALNPAPGGGGIVYIPPGTYRFTNPVNIPLAQPGTDPGIIIAGAGGGTVLEQDELENLFSFTGLSSGNGLRIRDLTISYKGPAPSSPPTPTAVWVSDCEAVTCERVVFLNWPQALYLDNRADQCGLRDCRISYGYGSTSVSNSQTMVSISGTEDFIEECIIEQPSQAPGSSQVGPTLCTAILITNAASVLSVTHTHISQFTFGINIQGGNPNPVRAFFSKVLCECWTNAVIIKPASNAGRVYQVFLSDCIFARETDSSDTTSVGVVIDTNGGPSVNASEIFLSNCLCYLWNTAGIQINAGQNIVINGGRYGSNASSVSTSGGIAVTGTTPNVVPANVSIVGADFTSQLGEVPPPPEQQFPQQPHALSVTAAVAGLFVRGCNFSGYSSPNSPVYTSGAGTAIEITDCAGYNDQGTVLQASAVSPTGTFKNTYAWANAPQGWFGPIAFYVTGTLSGVSIDGQNTFLDGGGFTLAPGENASISGQTAHFLAVGR